MKKKVSGLLSLEKGSLLKRDPGEKSVSGNQRRAFSFQKRETSERENLNR